MHEEGLITGGASSKSKILNKRHLEHSSSNKVTCKVNRRTHREKPKTKVRKDFVFAYPAVDSLSESCDKGGIGEPPLSSDGVLDKNKLPPISETNVMGEL